MKIRHLIYICVALTLAGCRTHRQAQDDTPPALPEAQAVSAKMKLRLEADGKSITCGGTCRMITDDVVQLNLTYTMVVVTMNVGSMQLTRDSILVVDRLNKRYCRAAWSQVPELRKAGVDFRSAQEFFWAEAREQKGKRLSMSQGKKKLKADVNLSRVQQTADWPHRISVPGDYQHVPLNYVMNALISAAQ